MADIKKIPTSELKEDLAGFRYDLTIARKLYTAKTLYGRPIEKVIETCEKGIKIINEELKRRENE